MATYNQVSYGAKDKETVTELQKLLNQNGANLTVDGIFGSQTQQAVKDYQKANNLSVDGIVGNQTWGALTKAQNTSASDSTQVTAPEETKSPTFEYKPYQHSDTVAQAEALLQQQLANKPGEYTSAWQTQLNDTLNKILNREKFSYDLNGDALYQQYKDQYTTQGKLAMMDTMGQAAALTGGYGNSYAQNVGQQAYQGYLQQLNDVVPELYGLALDQYNAEGDRMVQQFGMLGDMADTEYGRYQDDLAQYWQNLSFSKEQADDAYNRGFAEWQTNYENQYQAGRDQVADQQWQAEFDEAKRQYDQAYALQKSASSGSSSGSKSSSSGGGYDNNGYDKSVVEQAQRFVGADADGLWGSKSAAAAKKMGYNSLAEVVAAMGGGVDTKRTSSDALNTAIKNAGSSAEGQILELQAMYNRGEITEKQLKDLAYAITNPHK